MSTCQADDHSQISWQQMMMLLPKRTLQLCQRIEHAVLLAGGLTPPSVMPIDSPHETCIRRKRKLLEGCTAPQPAWLPVMSASPHSRCGKPQPATAECCTCLPVCHSCPQQRPGSFGCSVDLPLGSRSADPHPTAVGAETCSTPVLNHTQQG